VFQPLLLSNLVIGCVSVEITIIVQGNPVRDVGSRKRRELLLLLQKVSDKEIGFVYVGITIMPRVMHANGVTKPNKRAKQMASWQHRHRIFSWVIGCVVVVPITTRPRRLASNALFQENKGIVLLSVQ